MPAHLEGGVSIMGLKERVNQDIKQAMRDKDKVRLTAVRALRGEILKLEKSGPGGEATDEAVLKMVKSLVKRHQDAIAQFAKGGREDLVDKEKAELAVLQGYLPEQMTEDILRELVEQAVAEVGAETMKDMGKVMGALQGKIKAAGKDADNRVLAQLVKAKLS